MIKVYLAGPDVFLPDPMGRADALRQICHAHGLCGVSPLDPLPGEVFDPAALADPYAIARRNEAHIRNCDAILANLTPFRGPSADVGTVYEVGYGRALGRPVFGYATAGADHGTRVRGLPGSSATLDAAGLSIEDFGLFENLMISCGIEASGGFVLAEEMADRWGDLSVFARCAAAAARALAVTPPGSAPPLPVSAMLPGPS